MTLIDWLMDVFKVKKTYQVKFSVYYGEEDLGEYIKLVDVAGKVTVELEDMLYETLTDISKGSITLGLTDQERSVLKEDKVKVRLKGITRII